MLQFTKPNIEVSGRLYQTKKHITHIVYQPYKKVRPSRVLTVHTRDLSLIEIYTWYRHIMLMVTLLWVWVVSVSGTGELGRTILQLILSNHQATTSQPNDITFSNRYWSSFPLLTLLGRGRGADGNFSMKKGVWSQDTLLKDWQSSLAPSYPIRILFICCVYFTLIMKL